MRCNNCGWNNPDGVSKCQKCNQPLVMETVPFSQKDGSSTVPMGNVCPNCGYAISEGTVICPICKTEIRNADDDVKSVSGYENTQKTVMMDASKGISDNQQMDVKHTVVDAQPVHSINEPAEPSKVVDLKKTVCDFSRIEDKVENKVSEQNPEGDLTEEEKIIETEQHEQFRDEQQFSYDFECMDSDEHDKIVLVSKSELFLKEDEVILIAGLRFRRTIE